MSDPNRSITFTMDGGPGGPDLIIEVIEGFDGTLHFEYQVVGDTELRGLYFDFNNATAIDNLHAAGDQVTAQAYGDEAVTRVSNGNNMHGTGSRFDGGLTFGSNGVGADTTDTGTFILSATDGTPLSLDDIANVEFGARLTSDGLKLVSLSPAAPDAIDDTIVTDEDTAADETAPNANLLDNDTDADGDTLTVVAINGNPALVGTQFSLPTGGLITVRDDGTFDIDPNGQYEDLAVGESRPDSFTYRITDELVDPNNQGFDTATVDITITGLNDQPVITVEAGDSEAETVVETNATLSTGGSLTVSDVDVTDVVIASVFSVVTGGEDSDVTLPNNGALLAMLTLSPEAPAVLLDGTEVTDTLGWTFNSGGEAFNYLADDEFLTLDYTVRAADDNGAKDDRVVRLTVDGTNDRPVAQDVSASVGEDAASVTGMFLASDLDTSDTLSFEILGQPMDNQGHQYGEVINNHDGSFDFKPLDNFQFLEENESRDVTFQYRAIDDSGTGNDTSVARTATITVNGAYDAPIQIDTQVVFESFDQSMWETGPATIIDYRDFFGVSWDESFNESLLAKKTFTIIPKVGISELGLSFGPVTVSTPSVGISGGTTGRFGISPYFYFNSGDVDSIIPVDVSLTYAVQYEDTDTISLVTGYVLNDGAVFDTESPNITVGLDLVFEATAWSDLKINSTKYALFPDININVDEAEPVAGEPTSGDGTTATLLEFSSVTGISSDIFDTPEFEEDGEYTIPIFDDSSLVLSFPFIETVSGPPVGDRLTSTGSDDFAVLTLDVDDLLSQTKYFPPVRFTGDEGLPKFKVDLPGWVNDLGWDDVNIDLFSINWDVELFDLDLIGTLTAVQDFILDIEDLPIVLTLEGGLDEITGNSLGDTIVFDAPDWDLFAVGDMDGELDYTLGIDIEALFNNWTTLDFSLDLFAGILKATGGWTSDLIPDKSFNLFGDAEDPFLLSETYNLIEESPLATLWGDEDPGVSGFDLEGWLTQQLTGYFDFA
jgi:VCBS repeat-containing protein